MKHKTKITNIELNHRIKHIKSILENNQDIKNNDIVISWNISNRQIDRYIKAAKENKFEKLSKIRVLRYSYLYHTKIENLIYENKKRKATYNLPNDLLKELDKYSKNNQRKKQEVVIEAIYRYIKEINNIEYYNPHSEV